MDQDIYKDWYTTRVPAGTWLRNLDKWCNNHCSDQYALPKWPWSLPVQCWAVVEIKFKAQSDLIQYELTWC